MRWSEDGFNRLLYVRVSWVNQRFNAALTQLFHFLILRPPGSGCAPRPLARQQFPLYLKNIYNQIVTSLVTVQKNA